MSRDLRRGACAAGAITPQRDPPTRAIRAIYSLKRKGNQRTHCKESSNLNDSNTLSKVGECRSVNIRRKHVIVTGCQVYRSQSDRVPDKTLVYVLDLALGLKSWFRFRYRSMGT
ncbi:hypothetical protein EVAR_43757_1 [Eumeta japonica]|uniref:Uncharacterized protein n=1 Tax=Eumeta variegata TaxID=151549 RepID=A0A4C1XL50_EUMVA|nr:hypothetical protein EVAR_43757_1 [Eumeta japonica]